MADKEFIGSSRFEFTSGDKVKDLYVQSISGLSIKLPVTSDNGPGGVKGGTKLLTQAAPSAVESQEVTIVFVTNSEKPKAVADWFYKSHADREKGGATGTKGELQTAKLDAYKQDGAIAATWEFTGVMPKSYKMSGLDAASNQTLTETITFAYERLMRTK